MANICSTEYILDGDKKQLERLSDKLYKFCEAGMPARDFVLACGSKNSEIEARTIIASFQARFDKDDGVESISLVCYSAWVEPEDFRRWMEGEFRGIGIHFVSEEYGCGYFVTNDADGKYFIGPYIFRYGGEVDYYKDLGDIYSAVGEITGIYPNSMEELKEIILMHNINSDGDLIIFDEFQLVD